MSRNQSTSGTTGATENVSGTPQTNSESMLAVSKTTLERRYPNMGDIIIATHVESNRPDRRQTINIIILLTASVALMMTGFGIIMPVFARRLAELGAGVEALGLMTMAFALAQLVAAPFMGTAADRFGRRPLILFSLFSFILLNIGYLLADSPMGYVIIRAAGGALTAGLGPASMALVADLVPERERGKWLGIVSGGYGAGFVLGPVIGGLLYDNWGFAAPFIVSAVLGALAFLAAFIVVPETRTKEVRRREAMRARRLPAEGKKTSFWQSMPRPLTVFFTLLSVDFVASFAFAYVEPQMVFYLYDDLLWTTVQFGLVVAAYGLAMMFGQIFLGQTSDRVGRKPVILLGIMLNSLLFLSIAFARSFWVISVLAMIAGLGEALRVPAVNASYLDISEPQHRSRVLGVKSSALSLGGVLGPLLVVFTSRYWGAQGVFYSALVLVWANALTTAIFLREPKKVTTDQAIEETPVVSQRGIAAQTSLRGIVLDANRARERIAG